MDNDGRRDGNLTVMDGAARWRWTMQRQLYGEGRRHGDSTAMDDEERNVERNERDGGVGAAGGGSDKCQCGIKTQNVVID